MSLGLYLKVFPFLDHGIRSSRRNFPASGFPVISKSAITVRCGLNKSPSLQKSIEKIRERITNEKVEMSPSAYDTAWVAMVPAREHSSGKPCFPECLDWIIENQNPDGSWGLNPGHQFIVKDSLSCTLACLLALRKWNVGHEQLQKGLEFIRANTWAASDKDQLSPIGFNVVFPTMICHANELDLTLPFDQDLLGSMTRIRDSEINSERNQNLEYFAEGLVGESSNWDNILMTHQRSNGSLFNSPATTAAAVIHGQDNKCFEYLQSLLIIFKAWVPNTYPLDIYTRLCLIDIIQGLGIGRYFQSEFYSILEETYRLWQLKEEEIFADISCCAMAFRLLRSRGFEVSSDALAPYAEKDHVSLQTNGVGTILELYRASQIRINEEETTLEAINDWTTTFLKEQLLSKTILDKKLEKQVEYELKNFHGTLERVGNRQMIELYDVDNYQIRKTAYRCPTIYNEDFLVFSRQDFNVCQAQNQKELQEFERWYVDCRLDTLKYPRDVKNICHFLASSIFADPQLSDARLSYAKTIVLVSCADDFFDHYGSREQSYEILQLVKEWNEKSDVVYGSKEVEIIFKAVYRTVNDYAEKAYVEQGRCVKHHLINLWVELLTCTMKELDSWWDEATMTLDEYLSFSRVTIGAKICTLTSIHFIGVRISDDMILSQECTSMCMHVGIVDRLLNDIQTFKREEKERKFNGMSILKEIHKDEEIAVSEIRKVVEYNRRKLFKIGYERGTILPKECKDVFLETCKMGYYVYSSGDEFTSPRQMMDDMRSLIHQPVKVI